MRTRDFTYSKVKKSPKFKHPKFVNAVKIQENESIFENQPKIIKAQNSSVRAYNKMASNASLDFKSLPRHLQISMQEKVGQVLKNKMSRARNSYKKRSNQSTDKRQEIALRIISKLQRWPHKEEKDGKAFKKFYWTKDYSHCAFANENEVANGFLVKY